LRNRRSKTVTDAVSIFALYDETETLDVPNKCRADARRRLIEHEMVTLRGIECMEIVLAYEDEHDELPPEAAPRFATRGLSTLGARLSLRPEPNESLFVLVGGAGLSACDGA